MWIIIFNNPNENQTGSLEFINDTKLKVDLFYFSGLGPILG